MGRIEKPSQFHGDVTSSAPSRSVLIKKWITSLPFAVTVVLLLTVGSGATLVFNTSDSQFDPGTDNQGFWSSGPNVSSTDDSENYIVGMVSGDILRHFFTWLQAGQLRQGPHIWVAIVVGGVQNVLHFPPF